MSPSRAASAEAGAALWIKCPRCRELIYRREYDESLKVCPKCDYHFRLTARERIALTFDDGGFQELDAGMQGGDPLGFVALGKAYRARLREAQEATGLAEAAVYGEAEIGGMAVVAAVMDSFFLGASMGSVVGEKIARAAERAVETKRPLFIVAASGGARMHEGLFSLMQMAKTTAGIAELAERGLPYICLMTDPTYAGVAASFVSQADVILAEPGASMGFAGPRVIEKTTRHKLPPHAGTASFALEHGMIDAIVRRVDLPATVGRLLRLYQRQA